MLIAAINTTSAAISLPPAIPETWSSHGKVAVIFLWHSVTKQMNVYLFVSGNRDCTTHMATQSLLTTARSEGNTSEMCKYWCQRFPMFDSRGVFTFKWCGFYIFVCNWLLLGVPMTSSLMSTNSLPVTFRYRPQTSRWTFPQITFSRWRRA